MAELDGIRRALVVGLGRSGGPCVLALVAAGVHVTAVDQDEAADASMLPAGVMVSLGTSGVEALHDIDLVVASPGVPDHASVIRAATEAGIPIWSEPELAWRLAPRRMVAITGTNGKTSTTELAAAMLAADGQDAIACGNIGTPLVVAAPASQPDATLVAELSSFQLRHAHTLRPRVGILLNIADDHLDWHGSRDAYVAAKERLWQAQADDDWAVVHADDAEAIAMATRSAKANLAVFSGRHLPGEASSASTDAVACGIQVGVGVRQGKLVSTIPSGRGTVLSLEELTLQAPHHLANVAAAACAAILMGASHDAIRAAAIAYQPGRHRMELVVTAGGIRWINDSKATNPHAAAAALDGVGSTVWIAGGLAKGVDLSVLAGHLAGVREAFVIGEAAAALATICESEGVPVHVCTSIEDACDRAALAARDGDAVLLSPACASFDQFRDYAERGDRFADAARSHGGLPRQNPPDVRESHGNA